MSRARAEQEPVDAEERRRIEHNLDRIEDRLRDAAEGFHTAGPPADPDALAASDLPPAAQLLWAACDGFEFASGESRLLPVAALGPATAAAAEEGRLRPGDLVIGERGRDLLVLCADPHAEGADVVLVEEDGERMPHSSTVDRLVLALLGEAAVLYDQDGEFQEDLFGESGELSREAERRLLRRHLDLDPDAPLARFRLAQALRRDGALRGAAGELRQLLRRAPEFAWAHHELGRVRLAEGRGGEAAASFERAAELAGEPGLQAYFTAWACLALTTGPEAQEHKGRREALAAKALARSPALAAAQEAAVRAALEDENAALAEEQLQLGLAVVPGHLGLLSLRAPLAELRARLAEQGEVEEGPLEEDPDADADPSLLEEEAERMAALAPERPRAMELDLDEDERGPGRGRGRSAGGRGRDADEGRGAGAGGSGRDAGEVRRERGRSAGGSGRDTGEVRRERGAGGRSRDAGEGQRGAGRDRGEGRAADSAGSEGRRERDAGGRGRDADERRGAEGARRTRGVAGERDASRSTGAGERGRYAGERPRERSAGAGRGTDAIGRERAPAGGRGASESGAGRGRDAGRGTDAIGRERGRGSSSGRGTDQVSRASGPARTAGKPARRRG